MRTAFLLLVPLLLPVVRADSAPTPAPLGLDEAIRRALTQNFVIASARFEPLIARARQCEAAGRFDPVFSIRYDFADDGSSVPSDPFSGSRPPASIIKTDTVHLSLGGVLPSGLNYALVGQTQNQRGTYNRFADTFYAYGGIRLSQPLLRGFGFGSNLAGLRIARSHRATADASLEQAVSEVVTRTIAAFNHLYLAQRSYETALDSRDRAEALLRETRRRFEVGTRSSADVITVETRVAALASGILQAERAVHDAENRLRSLISAEARPTVETPLPILSPDLRPPPAGDRTAERARAFARRPEYRLAAENVRRAEIGVAEARSRSLPQVDLVGAYGYNGSGTTFDRAYRDARHGRTSSWSAGTVVSIPLPAREGRGRHRAACLALAQARSNLQQVEQDIVIAIANAAGQLDTAAQRIEATRRVRELSQRSLEAEEKRLQIGQTSTFNFIQIQELLSTAQNNEVRAIVDYNLALATYDQSVGATLEVHGIQLAETARR